MKKLFLVLLFPILPLLATAQDYPRFSPGFRFDPTIGWVRAESNNPNLNVNSSSAGLGFSVGIMGDYMIKETYGISVEARITQFSASFVESGVATLFASKITNDLSFQYFEIPVSLKMMTSEFGYSRVYFQAGVIPSVLARARVDVTTDDGTKSTTVKNQNIYKQTIPLDFSIFAGLGMEYNLSGTTNLLAGLSYHDGLVNLSRSSDITLKSRYISLDLGIKF